ncbi:cupin domain-containing protein [Algoriphagus winogradskyi]|uniref:Enterochelin esterase n=1 Tax=Algoriphagus winogradskyi TaxID=237017 RepID=A0ABY1PCI2_9BACT|nr:cupin domain-containing protein [Algoriphagus winogradskyi]SMP31185.1 Enterochelin esterase [Algoriphagus winogradskyi]
MKAKIFILLFLLLIILRVEAQDGYKYGPNSEVYETIPKGTVTKHSWESTTFPNTIRDYYIYIPAQYEASQPAALMIFQDGHAYVNSEGDFKVPTVFDNLIAQGKMPVTIGLFINPGHNKSLPEPENPWRASNRSLEYDDMSSTYSDFLLNEIIPELKMSYNIADDPKMRAIAGLSSGAICAFSAAWFHPESFHKVLSHYGSFTDIRGGHNYPPMIRKTDKKDLKVFMQDGSSDLNNHYGNWWLANLQMESALKFKDYEYEFVGGTGGHNGNHSGSILPESLAWLWSDVVPKRVVSQVYSYPSGNTDTLLMEGETMHLDDMVFSVNFIKPSAQKTFLNAKKEQILIIKEGEVKATLDGKSKTLGANSVVVLMPGDQAKFTSTSEGAAYFQMAYTSKGIDMKRGKKAGSEIFDYSELEFKEHDRGGIRDYFHRETSMCPYYEMHMTNLNPGIKSHEPHTHLATEIVIMIEGETEMEIGNQKYLGKAGDVYFLGSSVPHAIRNTGNEQTRYLAFQWN